MKVENKLYRKIDLAKRYGVSPVTIWRYVKDGLIPTPSYIRRYCVWTPEQVDEADKKILKSATPLPPISGVLKYVEGASGM
jgi:predicted DNA-binding transcriptional regulator AlpA